MIRRFIAINNQVPFDLDGSVVLHYGVLFEIIRYNSVICNNIHIIFIRKNAKSIHEYLAKPLMPGTQILIHSLSKFCWNSLIRLPFFEWPVHPRQRINNIFHYYSNKTEHTSNNCVYIPVQSFHCTIFTFSVYFP